MANDYIVVKEILISTATNEDGDILFSHIKDGMDKGNKVSVSFEGIGALNTSFVNSAFVQLLDFFSFDFIKKHLHLSNSTKNINDLVRRRMSEENVKQIS